MRDLNFTLIAFLMFFECKRSVALPHIAVLHGVIVVFSDHTHLLFVMFLFVPNVYYDVRCFKS